MADAANDLLSGLVPLNGAQTRSHVQEMFDFASGGADAGGDFSSAGGDEAGGDLSSASVQGSASSPRILEMFQISAEASAEASISVSQRNTTGKYDEDANTSAIGWQAVLAREQGQKYYEDTITSVIGWQARLARQQDQEGYVPQRMDNGKIKVRCQAYFDETMQPNKALWFKSLLTRVDRSKQEIYMTTEYR